MRLDDLCSLPVLAERTAAERADATGFLVPGEGGFRAVPYGAWWSAIENLAVRLRRAGVQPGDRVLLMMETRYEWLICDLAILSCGAWSVPIYPNLPSSQLAHPIEDAEPCAAVVTRPELAMRLLRAPVARQRLNAIFVLDGTVPRELELPVHSVRAILDGPSAGDDEKAALRQVWERIAPADPATILYTSGTGSTPKGVVLTHASILANGRSIAATLSFSPADRYLSILPLAHTMERTVSYTMIANGVCIAYARGIETFARDAGLVRPTVFLGVPRLFNSVLVSVREAARARGGLAPWMLRMAEAAAMRRGRRGPSRVGRGHGIELLWERLFFRPLRERFGGQLRYIVSGSAPLGRRENLFLCGAGLPMLEGYGLTEAGPVVSVNTPAAWKEGSVGRPLAGVDVRIAEDREILVRSPGVMAGYWNLEAETHRALEGGWLHTGDLGELDGDGFLTITGRKKEMIVTSGGKNVAPQPIEDRLRQSPFIREAVVFGDRRPHLVALLVIDRDALAVHMKEESIESIAEPRLRLFLRKEIQRLTSDLAPHERIRNFDLLDPPPSIDAGTLTPSLKVRRSVLEAQQAERIAALFEARRR